MNKLFLLLLLLPLVSASMQIDLTPLNLTNSSIDSSNGTLYGIYFLNGTYYLQSTNFTMNITNYYNVTNVTYINNTYQNYTGNFTFYYYNVTNVTYTNSTFNGTDIYSKSEIDSKFGNVYSRAEVDSRIQTQTVNNVTNLSGQLDDIRAKIDAKNSNLWLWIVIIFAILLAIIAIFIAAGVGG